MLEHIFLEYLGPVAAILVVISVTAYLLPSHLGERISNVALGGFLAVVLFGLVLTVPHFIGGAR